MPSPTNTQFAVAVHVLTYLAGTAAAGEHRPVSSDELAASTNVTPVHVRRVMGPLRQIGLVTSKPGQRGGWVLGVDPAGISVVQVWDLVRGDEQVLGLHGPNPACPVGRGVQAALEDLDRAVAERVRAELAGVTIADLLQRTLAGHP